MLTDELLTELCGVEKRREHNYEMKYLQYVEKVNVETKVRMQSNFKIVTRSLVTFYLVILEYHTILPTIPVGSNITSVMEEVSQHFFSQIFSRHSANLEQLRATEQQYRVYTKKMI